MAKRTLDRHDDFTHREWPVSPSQYPLSGPSKGPTYSPAPRERNPWAFALNVLYLGAMMFAFGFAGYMLATTYFK